MHQLNDDQHYIRNLGHGYDNEDIIFFKSPKMANKEMGAMAMHKSTRAPYDSSRVKSPNSNLLQLHTLCMRADFGLNLGLT